MRSKRNKIEDQDLLTFDKLKQHKNIERSNKAADLGLKALNKIGRDSYDKRIGITNDDRFWFLYEDQTIGLGMVADLVNQGKSKKQIQSMVYQAINSDNHYKDGVFEFVEGSGHDIAGFNNFIDACIDVKNNK